MKEVLQTEKRVYNITDGRKVFKKLAIDEEGHEQIRKLLTFDVTNFSRRKKHGCDIANCSVNSKAWKYGKRAQGKKQLH